MAYLDENGLEHFWGKIKDRVSSAVAPKANDADVVHKTGNETVSGEKVFSSIQTTTAGNASALLVIKDPNLVKGEMPETNHYLSLGFIDSTGNSYAQDVSSRLAAVQYKSPSERSSSSFVELAALDFNGSGSALLQVGYDGNNIRFASAPATSDDRTASTDIVTRGYMEASEWNWQKTKKAAMVAFKPVPESDLEPVVDFAFMETPPVSGDKAPDNPSIITGAAAVEIGRCGKNLLVYPYIEASHTHPGGLTATANSDGSVKYNGTGSTSNQFFSVTDGNSAGTTPCKIELAPGTQYTFSLKLVSGNVSDSSDIVLAIIDHDAGAYIGTCAIGASTTFTATNRHFRARLESKPNVLFSNVVVAPQLELGSTATPFESYSGNEYTIQLGDTYYGGSLDVAAGVMTVTWWGHVFDGTEVMTLGSTYDDVSMIATSLSGTTPPPATIVTTTDGSAFCTHYPHLHDWGNHVGFAVHYDGVIRFFTSLSIASTAADLQSFFATQYAAGTPVVLTYPVKTPFTVQLTPTQIRSLPAIDKYEPRINAVYTDQEAVQVGYQRYVAEDNLVHKTGNEEISGKKTFLNDVITVKNNSYDKTVTPAATQIPFSLVALDKNEKAIVVIKSSHQQYLDTTTLNLECYKYNSEQDPASFWLNILNDGRRLSGIVADVFRPAGSLFSTLGQAGNYRWGQIYSTESAISTSDERQKQNIEFIPDYILDAWGSCSFLQFKKVKAVEEKGQDRARIHSGLIAQNIKDIFDQAGLDVTKYGLFCYDEWEASEQICDEKGNVVVPAEPAGDEYSIRYEEALCMEAAYMRRENARLKKRVADLEERLAALELKIS